MADEEEDDYLNMSFEDTSASAKQESSLQRTARLKKEAAARAKVPSKAERAAKAEEDREKALATELDPSNKGAQMLAKMGFKGGALGKTEGARTRPIEVQVKEDRGGIGIESEKKRKFREAAEALDIKEKRTKLDVNDYRERNRLEQEEKRQEGQMWSAMRVLEGFEEGDAPNQAKEDADQTEEKKVGKTTNHAPLRSVNILYRSLVKSRYEREKERRMRNDLAQSLSRRADYDDPDAEADDKLAFGNAIEDDLDEEDPELDKFEALTCGERLEKILEHLREKYHYCFWCKFRYSDEAMEGCPGVTEDEHG